ncbi:MAG: hypothetical protein R6Y91_09090 [Desulfohalobium sp.]
MRWKQFVPPVQSMEVKQAQGLINTASTQELHVLDVRQANA